VQPAVHAPPVLPRASAAWKSATIFAGDDRGEEPAIVKGNASGEIAVFRECLLGREGFGCLEIRIIRIH
jgi:hypothetical protein